ncbi:hypothetical protein KFE25_000145 [Diacronema lutheri]|uniref:NYN domain-containing protein n=2 Tax=Diacronema lutheri TaxID=2081491 RepID=A0A8J5XHB0_DIALT|nr:hypothetical protein KFE25_000145 [Diacronema lutheri]
MDSCADQQRERPRWRALALLAMLSAHASAVSSARVAECTTVRPPVSIRRVAPPSRRLRAESEALTQADVVIIDGDNVRGKLAFRWSTRDLAERTAAWARELELTGRVLLFFDHGDAADALWTSDGLAVAFAGQRASADDQIVAAVRFLSQEHAAVVTVATADTELRLRCAKAALCRRHLQTVSPIALIAALQESGLRSEARGQAGADGPEPLADGDSGARAAPPEDAQPSSAPPPLPLVRAAADAPAAAAGLATVALGTAEQRRARQILFELAAVRKQLRRGCARNKGAKLTRRRSELELALWRLQRAGTGGQDTLAQRLAQHEPAAPGLAAKRAPPHAARTELTSDRTLNAEAFRRQLRAAGASPAPPHGVRSAPSLAHYLARHFTQQEAPATLAPPPALAAAGSHAAAAEPSAGGARANAAPLRSGARLLAVDVGLREGGFAVLDAFTGAVLACGGLRGSPLLCAPVVAQLRAAVTDGGGDLCRLVLEGNAHMCAPWREALLAPADGDATAADGDAAGGGVADGGAHVGVQGPVDAVSVSAQSWRATMLTRRELRGRLPAKDAARQIARQLLVRSGLREAASARLDTNAAEAICVGHWACAFLWKPAELPSAAVAAADDAEGAARVEWPWVLVERTVAGEVILK